MRRRTHVVAGVLATAELGLAAATGAQAGPFTNTCTHGAAVNNSGHAVVRYVGASNPAGVHLHQYLHVTGGAIDHYTMKPC
jgi:hypothetical protein